MDPTPILSADTAPGSVQPGPVAPDHAVMIANAALAQAVSPTAMLAQRLRKQRRHRFDSALVALVGLFGAQDKVAAADILDGSFHPRVARRKSGGR